MVTPGVGDTPAKIAAARLPKDLRGKSVIDIGAWEGGFSFECERRGAERVLAADHFVWTRGCRAGFDFAHALLRSRVETKTIRVEDLSPDTVGVFDIVLFLGILYHAENMMQYLRNVYSVCRDLAVVETHVDALDVDRPAAVFYPGATLNGDVTNFWGPNPACVEAMLQEVGFRRVERFPPYQPTRMVFHAYR